MVRSGALLVCLTFWVLLVGYLAVSGGVTSPAAGLFAVIIIVSAVMLGVRGAVAFGLLAMVSAALLYVLELNGLLTSIEPAPTPGRLFATQTATFLILTLLMSVNGRSVWGALTRARTGERALALSNQQLQQEIAQRERSEEQLRQSEAELKQAQRVAHLGSWRWYIQSNRLEWSDEMYRIFDIDQESFTGDQDEALGRAIHPEDRAAVDMSNRAVIDGTPPEPLEYRVVRSDGTVRWVRAEAGELIFDAAGSPAVLTGIVQDITERKRSRDQVEQLVDQRTAELNRSMRRAEAILDNTTDGIVMASADRGIEQSNVMFKTLFDCEMDGYLGQPLLALVRPEDRDRLAALIQAVIEDGTSRHDEFRALRADNTLFEARMGIGSLHTGECTGASMVCTIQDISELKARERLLRFHASLQENVTDGVVTNDLEFRIQTWNPAAERIYGWSAQEVIGKHVNDVVQNELSEQERDAIARILREEGRWQGQVVQRHKDGSRLHILAALSLFTDEFGEPVGFVGINHDITQRVEAEQALQKKADEEREFQSALKAL